MQDDLLHRETTELILKSFYQVYNKLGYGFLERVYENALTIALQKHGCEVMQQRPIDVSFEGVIVGKYFADLVVKGDVIVEIKAATAISPAHERQLLNYLKATDIEVGLLLNFGETPEFKRKVFKNDRK